GVYRGNVRALSQGWRGALARSRLRHHRHRVRRSRRGELATQDPSSGWRARDDGLVIGSRPALRLSVRPKACRLRQEHHQAARAARTGDQGRREWQATAILLPADDWYRWQAPRMERHMDHRWLAEIRVRLPGRIHEPPHQA